MWSVLPIQLIDLIQSQKENYKINLSRKFSFIQSKNRIRLQFSSIPFSITLFATSLDNPIDFNPNSIDWISKPIFFLFCFSFIISSVIIEFCSMDFSGDLETIQCIQSHYSNRLVKVNNIIISNDSIQCIRWVFDIFFCAHLEP